MLSPRRRVLLISALVFILFAALAIFASPLSASNLEDRLERAAAQALYDARADDWARVEMEGQKAVLTGLAPGPAARDHAIEAVRKAAWAGGVVAGGITKVVDRTRLEESDQLFQLRADLVQNRLTLLGFAPDADGQARLVELAELLYPGRATLDVQLAPGAAPEGWEEAARLMLSELARLDTGTGLMRGDRMVVTGLSTNAQTVTSVRDAINGAPASFQAAALVRAPGGDYQSVIDDAALCEVAVRAALGPRPVAFTPGTPTLSEASANVLRRAGAAFSACEAGPLTVAVRQLDPGGTADLARARAEAIIAAMALLILRRRILALARTG